jgi:DNA-binding MarR family transcriptional regulator
VNRPAGSVVGEQVERKASLLDDRQSLVAVDAYAGCNDLLLRAVTCGRLGPSAGSIMVAYCNNYLCIEQVNVARQGRAWVSDETEERALDDIVDAVLAASRALVALSARSIAGVGDVTLPQYRMLVVLGDGPINLSTLAGALDVAPSTALRMVDRLISAGLVARTVRPQDRRETHLSLTSSGRRTVNRVTTRRRRDLRAVIALLPPHVREELPGAMGAFAQAAEQLWGAKA